MCAGEGKKQRIFHHGKNVPCRELKPSIGETSLHSCDFLMSGNNLVSGLKKSDAVAYTFNPSNYDVEAEVF